MALVLRADVRAVLQPNRLTTGLGLKQAYEVIHFIAGISRAGISRDLVSVLRGKTCRRNDQLAN